MFSLTPPPARKGAGTGYCRQSAGTAASALFGLAVYGLNEAVPELMTIAEAGKIAIILGSMIAGGIIISGLFTFAALNKFINMKSNKIYLY